MFAKVIFFLIGLITVYLLALLWSSNRKKVKYKNLLIILVVQLIVCYFILQSSEGIKLVSLISDGFNKILLHAHQGTAFVFGSLADTKKNGFVFFFNVGMPIVLISGIIGVLQYFKILPFVIRIIGFILTKITGMGKLESFNAVSSLTVGQQENFLIYKKIIGHLPANVLYTMAATAMSTVSLAIAGSYMSIIQPKYVCTAIVLNMLSTFFVLHIINPYDKDPSLDYDSLHQDYEEEKQSFFEMLSEYLLDGFKIAVIVCAMLIGFIALLNLVDSIFQGVLGITFRQILGYIFYPFAWVLNIHGNEIFLSSQIMGTKIVTNEFVAMQELSKHAKDLSEHTQAVVSVFLVSFANFSSIGIIVGAVQALNKEASVKVARFSLKILYGAVLVSLLSAVIVGFVI
ncbi:MULTISPECIES: NupC/NupG family nucleoside CNT transporter [unclassified Francisella]|uniref:NupC/NupG family nucleoside CNT transporter n=1 Tax=unclassified Francisella TaxID=2610885 RepID=UPI002E34F6B3|nr:MULTISPECIES: nucleoside transporter C-terminal domain-containing protein [unclassified Francisella]MED7819655.1 nucleoside transporter C-terminal domain-containing protein [Francisella sp. 19S2-4]MED7830474.1 nucleoside transporter C-terminal domain-containing protein [Francisella sp. 19S2-10]